MTDGAVARRVDQVAAGAHPQALGVAHLFGVDLDGRNGKTASGPCPRRGHPFGVEGNSPSRIWRSVMSRGGPAPPVRSSRRASRRRFRLTPPPVARRRSALRPFTVRRAAKLALALLDRGEFAGAEAEPRRLVKAALALGKKQLRWGDTPHLPHGWDCGFLFEAGTRTLLAGGMGPSGARTLHPGRSGRPVTLPSPHDRITPPTSRSCAVGSLRGATPVQTRPRHQGELVIHARTDQRCRRGATGIELTYPPSMPAAYARSAPLTLGTHRSWGALINTMRVVRSRP